MDDGAVDAGRHGRAQPYYTDLPGTAKGMLEALDKRAVEQPGPDEGSFSANVWDQAFREFQQAAVPVQFKAAALRALAALPGVVAARSTSSFGNLRGTALTLATEQMAFIFDEQSGVYLGLTYGIDNPRAAKSSSHWTYALITEVVPSAPRPDNAS